jgi:hypothetical protein
MLAACPPAPPPLKITGNEENKERNGERNGELEREICGVSVLKLRWMGRCKLKYFMKTNAAYNKPCK